MTAWRRAFDATTPWPVIEALVAERSAAALDELRDQLEDDDSLTEEQRATMLARAAPLIDQKVRETIEAAWGRLQATH